MIEKFMLYLFGAFYMTVMSCAVAKEATQGPCSPADLASIEARYVTEAVTACKAEGAADTETCKAWPAIRDRYRAERARYVECAP